MTTTELETPAPTGKWEAAMLAGGDPVARYWAMFLAHNQNEALEDHYLAAFEALHDHEPETSRDVVRKFLALFSNGGCPLAEQQEALIKQAKRALEMEQAA